MEKIDRAQVTNFLLGALVVGVVLGFLHFGQTLLVTLLVAIFLAYTLNPVVRWLRVLRLPYGVNVGLTLVLTFVVLFLVAQLVVTSLGDLNQELPRYEARLSKRIQEIEAAVDPWLRKISRRGDGEEHPPAPPAPEPPPDLRDLLPMLYSGATSVLSILFFLIIIPFMTFFMLLEKEKFRERITARREVDDAERAAAILEQISRKIQGYIAGKGVITVILAIVGSLGYWIVGLSFPVVWGVLYAVAVLIPFLGILIAGVPTALFCLVEFDGLQPVLFVGLVILVMQIVENYVLNPLILGDLVNLNPLAVILSVLFWGALWGPVGALLAIPITAVIKVFFDHTEIFEMAGRLLGGGTPGEAAAAEPKPPG